MATEKDQDRHDKLVKAFLSGLSAEEVERQRRREYRNKYPKATEAEIQLLMDADDKAGYPPQGLGHARYIMRTSAGSRLPAPTAKDFDDAALAVMKAHRDHLTLVANMRFCNLDRRPAVLDGDFAFAVLTPGGPWKSVDRWDVGQTAGVMSEAAWRKAFSSFAPLDLSKIEAQALPNSPLPSTMKFVDWDHRPAVLVGGKAFAVTRPGAPWKAVDESDVAHTGRSLTEDAWRKTFFGEFGKLDLWKIPKAADQKPAHDERPGEMALVLSRTLRQVAADIGDGQLKLYADDIERRARGVIEMYLSFRDWDETEN